MKINSTVNETSSWAARAPEDKRFLVLMRPQPRKIAVNFFEEVRRR